MKKIFFIIFLLVLKVNSQPIVNLEYFDKEKIQWGYYFGINTLDTKFDYKDLDYSESVSKYTTDIQTNKSIGFTVGMTGDLRLVEHLNLRLEPALLYNKRHIIFPGMEENRDKDREYVSTFIYIPMLLKYSTERWYNVKPYLTAGASMGINLSSNQKLNIDNSEMKFRSTKMNYFYEMGIGIDFYTPYFRFSPSIRGLFSFRNELIPDKDTNSPWTGNVNGLFTRGIMLNLTFE